MGPASTIDIAVTIHHGDWGDCAPAVEAAARLALAGESGPVAVDITLTDDPEQQRLNRTWRGKDAPTNVLAFPGDGPVPPGAPQTGAPRILGDVVLALSTIRREAAEQDKPFADHLRHLVVHGVLHLLGHDHDEPAAAAAMERREIALLAELGVPDPYRDTI
ncbi:MAG TPA: rRNA maturation RNase YbeY [Stellaceae bacterium]|jgi:probable rRNA maturation factor|nr:rRNA maturation RNase YbeY [Stellaceae bacterium]